MAASSGSHGMELRPSKTLSTQKQNAALQGAAMAFGKPPVKPKPTLKLTNQNPALAAASKADKDSASAARIISAQNTGTIADDDVGDALGSHHTGRGVTGTGLEAGMVRSKPSELARDEKASIQRQTKGNSESHIAATLAASRSASTSPNRKPNVRQQRTVYGHESHAPTDNTSSYLKPLSAATNSNTIIPPTSSLIDAFEQISTTRSPAAGYTRTDTNVASPIYQSSRTPTRQTFNASGTQHKNTLSYPGHDLASQGQRPILGNIVLSPPTSKIKTILSNTPRSSSALEKKPIQPGTEVSHYRSSITSVPASPRAYPSNPRPTTPEARSVFIKPTPKPKPKSEGPVASPVVLRSDLAEERFPPTPRSAQKSVGKYAVEHQDKSRGASPSRTDDDEDASSENSFVSASDGLPSDLKPEIATSKPRPIPPRQRQQSQRPLIPSRSSTATSQSSMTVNSLANAMVASALAASRSQSPSKPSGKSAPAPPPTRRSTTLLFANAHGSMSQSSRTPSPSKPNVQKHHTGGKTGMRTTMRKAPRSSDDEDETMVKRGRKNLMKKHPNKHHEGDRKRWRDVVSDRERKRYDGLWASNKGLFTSDSTVPDGLPGGAWSSSQNSLSTTGIGRRAPVNSPLPEDCVSGLIVRDIWSRSRLPDDVLSDIWELVNRTGTGILSKDEFVVGVWLVDQRLKGRKLPQRVSDSVWSSVGTLGGVKVKHKHAKEAGRKVRPTDGKELR